MPGLSLREAAKQMNVSKSTILRAIRNGRLSAATTEYGGYSIDPAELFRVRPPLSLQPFVMSDPLSLPGRRKARRGRVMNVFAAGSLAAAALIVGYRLPHQSKPAVIRPAVAPLVTGPTAPIPNSMVACKGAGLAADTTPRRISRQLEASEIVELLRRGNQVAAKGDLLGARLLFQRAAEAGDSSATLALAGTYDPLVLERLGERGLAPDVALARFWYGKARELGLEDTAIPNVNCHLGHEV